MVKNVVSLSGGKDSTALLLMMLKKNIPVHSAVFFDTGWEFPEMHEHIDKLESMIDVPIVRLQPEKSFDYCVCERPVISRIGDKKGSISRIGNGWPSPMRRWCTREKVRCIQKYLKKIPGSISCIGFAAEETKRVKNNKDKIYPLIEWGVSESQALAYCLDNGFDWSGLYKHFRRVSCFCCPFQRLSDLRTLRIQFPELWLKMLDIDSRIPANVGFKDYNTVHDLEKRFSHEDKQLSLWAA